MGLNYFFNIAVVGVVLIGPILAIIYFWHIVGPESRRWLDPEIDIPKLETIFSSAFSFFTGIGISFLIKRK